MNLNYFRRPKGKGLGNDNKNKTLKSSLFSFAAISILINYFSKIPFISKLLLKFKSKFGKRWFWHILVISRKVFIIFNALIGCYFVYKLCGFGSGSMFANIAGIGNSYLKILYSFWQGVFEFFCDLLDFKVVPKVPIESASPDNLFFNKGYKECHIQWERGF